MCHIEKSFPDLQPGLQPARPHVSTLSWPPLGWFAGLRWSRSSEKYWPIPSPSLLPSTQQATCRAHSCPPLPLCWARIFWRQFYLLRKVNNSNGILPSLTTNTRITNPIFMKMCSKLHKYMWLLNWQQMEWQYSWKVKQEKKNPFQSVWKYLVENQNLLILEMVYVRNMRKST